MVTLLLTDVPVDIDRDAARRAAQEELNDPKYQQARPSVLQEVAQWLGEQLEKLLNGLSSVVPGGIFGLLLILVLLIVLIVVVRLRTGKVARAARAAQTVFDGKRQSADDYRRSAAEAATTGSSTITSPRGRSPNCSSPRSRRGPRACSRMGPIPWGRWVR